MLDSSIGKKIMKLEATIKFLCEGFEETENKKQFAFSNKLRILEALSGVEKMSPTALVPRVLMAKTNLNILCNKLISDGLITKSHDEFDRRVVYYSITDEGMLVLEEAYQDIADNIEIYGYNIDDEQFKEAVENLLNVIE